MTAIIQKLDQLKKNLTNKNIQEVKQKLQELQECNKLLEQVKKKQIETKNWLTKSQDITISLLKIIDNQQVDKDFYHLAFILGINLPQNQQLNDLIKAKIIYQGALYEAEFVKKLIIELKTFEEDKKHQMYLQIIQLCEQALKLDPKLYDALRLKIKILIQSANYQQAVLDSQLLINWQLSIVNNKDPKEASKSLIDLVDQLRNNETQSSTNVDGQLFLKSHFYYAKDLYIRGEYKAALAQLNQVSQLTLIHHDCNILIFQAKVKITIIDQLIRQDITQTEGNNSYMDELAKLSQQIIIKFTSDSEDQTTKNNDLLKIQKETASLIELGEINNLSIRQELLKKLIDLADNSTIDQQSLIARIIQINNWLEQTNKNTNDELLKQVNELSKDAKNDIIIAKKYYQETKNLTKNQQQEFIETCYDCYYLFGDINYIIDKTELSLEYYKHSLICLTDNPLIIYEIDNLIKQQQSSADLSNQNNHKQKKVSELSLPTIIDSLNYFTDNALSELDINKQQSMAQTALRMIIKTYLKLEEYNKVINCADQLAKLGLINDLEVIYQISYSNYQLNKFEANSKLILEVNFLIENSLELFNILIDSYLSINQANFVIDLFNQSDWPADKQTNIKLYQIKAYLAKGESKLAFELSESLTINDQRSEVEVYKQLINYVIEELNNHNNQKLLLKNHQNQVLFTFNNHTTILNSSMQLFLLELLFYTKQYTLIKPIVNNLTNHCFEHNYNNFLQKLVAIANNLGAYNVAKQHWQRLPKSDASNTALGFISLLQEQNKQAVDYFSTLSKNNMSKNLWLAISKSLVNWDQKFTQLKKITHSSTDLIINLTYMAELMISKAEIRRAKQCFDYLEELIIQENGSLKDCQLEYPWLVHHCFYKKIIQDNKSLQDSLKISTKQLKYKITVSIDKLKEINPLNLDLLKQLPRITYYQEINKKLLASMNKQTSNQQDEQAINDVKQNQIKQQNMAIEQLSHIKNNKSTKLKTKQSKSIEPQLSVETQDKPLLDNQLLNNIQLENKLIVDNQTQLKLNSENIVNTSQVCHSQALEVTIKQTVNQQRKLTQIASGNLDNLTNNQKIASQSSTINYESVSSDQHQVVPILKNDLLHQENNWQQKIKISKTLSNTPVRLLQIFEHLKQDAAHQQEADIIINAIKEQLKYSNKVPTIEQLMKNCTKITNDKPYLERISSYLNILYNDIKDQQKYLNTYFNCCKNQQDNLYLVDGLIILTHFFKQNNLTNEFNNISRLLIDIAEHKFSDIDPIAKIITKIITTNKDNQQEILIDQYLVVRADYFSQPKQINNVDDNRWRAKINSEILIQQQTSRRASI